jgi:hypothetical protein
MSRHNFIILLDSLKTHNLVRLDGQGWIVDNHL